MNKSAAKPVCPRDGLTTFRARRPVSKLREAEEYFRRHHYPKMKVSLAKVSIQSVEVVDP